MTPFPIIEEFSIVAPLGVCFHDTTTGERVADGLSISAYPVNSGVWKNKTALRPNRFGVYALQKIKGSEAFSNGKGNDEFWNNNPPENSYVIEVSDIEQRFLSFRFSVELPVKGIYKWENVPVSSPNKILQSIPLYSAPTRKTSGGMSVVRAQLREIGGDVPASNSVLEARFDGSLVARGISGDDGQIVLIFPSLAPQSAPLASPPAASRRVLLAEQQWNLDLTIKYQPNIFQTSPPETHGSREEKLPDLRLALAQAEGTLWADDRQTEELETAVLQFGRELVLRSRKIADSPALPDSDTAFSSFLYVSPAN